MDASRTGLLLVSLAVGLISCSETSSTPKDTEDPTDPGPITADLRSESELTSNCYNWPTQQFSPSKTVAARTSVDEGERAIDFTLENPEGVSYKLSDLLETRPVLIVFGAFT